MIFKSLRWRVQAGHFIAMLIFSPMVAWGIFLLFKSSCRIEAEQTIAITLAHTSTETFKAHHPEIYKDLPSTFWYSVYDANQSIVTASEHAPKISRAIASLPMNQFASIDGHLTLISQRGAEGITLLAGIPETEVYAGLQTVAAIIILLWALLIITSIYIGWWGAGKCLEPIEQFTDTVKAIRDSKSYQPIDISGAYHELRELGHVMDDTFQKLDHALERQRTLTADASHEFRTPLSTIMVELESALRIERSPEEYRERIQSSLNATNHLKRLVEGLLILARSDAEQIQLELRPVNLKTICEEAIAWFAHKADEAHARIESQLHPLDLMGEEESLRQVMLNLIGNALQYAGPSPLIQISLTKEKEMARITVDDNGQGIPEGALPNIFERFYRVDKARTGSHQGNLGLGLAICKTIVEAHHGTISAEKSPLSGARFKVVLPIKAM